MKLRGRQPDRTAAQSAVEPGAALPPPDPWTRVELVVVGEGSRSQALARLHTGDVVAAAGIGGLLVAGVFTFIRVLDPPSASDAVIVAVVVIFVVAGMVLRRRSRHTQPKTPVPVPVLDSVAVVDNTPSLIGEIGVVLAGLRHKHGVAYRSHTWVEDVLPAYGATLGDVTLARDLLAVAALDAGGIRADVSNLAEARSREAIIETCQALLTALRNVLEACEGSPAWPTPPRSDPSRWPLALC